MVDAFRAMLDELMGKERDAPLHARSNRKVDFNDPEVCKYELVASCPNQLFRNTKCDLGKQGIGTQAGCHATNHAGLQAARQPSASALP